MDVSYIQNWREHVTASLDRLLPLFEARFGYPPAPHTIDGQADEHEHGRLASLCAPRDLLDWYAQVREVSLPDVGNGYFHPRPVLVAVREVRSVRGRFAADVFVFASDGGGTLFAVGAATGSPVYRLPPGEIYRSDELAFDVMAGSMTGFLERLRDAVRRFTDAGAVSDLQNRWRAVGCSGQTFVATAQVGHRTGQLDDT